MKKAASYIIALTTIFFLCLSCASGVCYANPQKKASEAKPSPFNGDTQKESPPLLRELKARKDKLGFTTFLETSTVEAERFRRSLLIERDKISNAELVARASVEFAKLESPNTAKAKNNLAQYSLERFALTAEQIVSAIAGEAQVPDPAQFYGSFEGKWYGIWDGNNVDHHWGPYTPVDPIGKFRNSEGAEVCLNGYQYAWVGDGYGLNHVASSTDGTKKYLLGYVIHLKDEKLEQEVVRRPHVGVIDGTDRLIWLTKSEVFFEEMIRGRGDVPDRYYIRGFRYSIDEVKRELSASEAFQVVYSRKADKREPWRGFKIKLLIK